MSKLSKDITEQDYNDYIKLINGGLSQRKACKQLDIERTKMQRYLKKQSSEVKVGDQSVLDTYVSPLSNVGETFKSFGEVLSRALDKGFKEQRALQEEIKSKKPTILVIADTQCKSEEDLEYMLWIGHYINEKRPDVIVHIGDHYDFPSLSSYDKGKASAEGKRLYKDIEAGNTGFEFLNLEMSKDTTYNPRKIFCCGNHENRLDRYVEDNPELIGTLGVDKLPFEKYGWEVYPFLKPVEVEGIFFVHFLANPMNGKPYGGNAMNILKTVGRSFVVGHKQCLDIAIRPTIDGKQQIGIVNGACYDHFEKYKGHTGNNHFRGLTVLHEVSDGMGVPMFVSLDYMKEKYYS